MIQIVLLILCKNTFSKEEREKNFFAIIFIFLGKPKAMLKLFDLSLQVNGFPIAKAKEEFAAFAAVSAEDYPEFIEKRKQAIVDFHLKHNPFYRNLVGNETFTSWNNLPVVTKKQLQKPLYRKNSFCE